MMRQRSPKSYEVRRYRAEDLTPEEILLDKEAQTTRRLEKPFERRNVMFFAGLIGTTLLFLFARTFVLTVLRHQRYLRLAAANHTRRVVEQPFRGLIYDRAGRTLVENVPLFDLISRQETSQRKGREPGMTVRNGGPTVPGRVAKKQAPDRPGRAAEGNAAGPGVRTATEISRRQAIVFAAQAEASADLALEIKSQRTYPGGAAFSHVLGYLSRADEESLRAGAEPSDLVGKSGVERTFETLLRGGKGQYIEEIDASGNALRIASYQPPQPGQNLVLALDGQLQSYSAERLTQMVRQRRSPGGAVVALDPRNGDVLALVSAPLYDANLFRPGSAQGAPGNVLRDPGRALFNRAIAGRYPPGSTIKPFIAAAALAENRISPAKIIVDEGAISVRDVFNPAVTYTFRSYAPLGPVNMESAIALSSDVYFYTIGGGHGAVAGLGPEPIAKYLKQFGFGLATGISMPGETGGLVPTPEWRRETQKKRWHVGDTYNISIGQGDLGVTPLQLALATAALANNGTLWKPRLALGTIDSELRTLRDFPAEASRRDFIAPETLATVRSGMRQAVRWGTAKALRDLPVEAAAKTGTAQTGAATPPHSLITVFAPYQNPEIVLAVIVEQGGESTQAALPLAREILQWYFGRNRPIEESPPQTTTHLPRA